MTPDDLLGSPTPGHPIVTSNAHNAWRALVPPAFVALIITTVNWRSHAGAGGYLVPAALVLAGAGRMSYWYACGDDSLWDDGVHLIYSRGGRVVRYVAWQDVMRATMSTGSRFPELRNWIRRFGPPAVPEVTLWSSTAPESTLLVAAPINRQWAGQFATLIILTRSETLAAQDDLAKACREHGASF
jgi:hypothetical protein